MADRGQVDAGLEERDRRAVPNAVGVEPLLAQIRSHLSREVQAVCENVPDETVKKGKKEKEEDS